MTKGVNLIERLHIVFSQESNGNNKTKMILSLREDANEQQSNNGTICHTIKPVTFVAGDLAFLAYLMGKDNFSLTWCNWCKIPSSVWKMAANTNIDDLHWSVD